MCGFCGFTGQIASPEEILESMKNKIIHRGPDSDGSHLDDGIAMGFRRLSFVDLEGGSQPIYNETKDMVITFNGEIYNHRELREELEAKGHVMGSRADTEVLIHGYEEWGEELLQKLRGMFAFVIWDKKNKSIFGARDFFGIKPFYYTIANGNLIYASEIKAILAHPDVRKEVNPIALENYLTFQYSVLEETFFKGIFKLMPAHCFTFKDGKMDIKRYWEPVFEADHSKSLEEYVDEIDAAMQDSIKAHKVADVEVGSFLSSGVDSSYVAACFHGDKTFTVGFDYEKYNEIDYAKALSEKIKIDNYSKLISKKEYWDSIPTVQYHMDEPLADASAIALYFVTKTASEQVKTCMSGEGADELFGGYNIYREPHDLLPLTRLPRPIRKGLGAMAQKLPKMKGKNYLIRGSKDLQERFIGNAFMLNEAERERILKHPTGKYPHTALTKPFCAPERTRSRLTRLPSSAPIESITILLPAPVSPESTVRPLSSSMSARSMTAIFSMWSNCSIAALSLAYFRISLACLQNFCALSLSRITANTVSSPPSVPTTSGARMASIAIAAACPRPGSVLMTTIFCAASISVTHSRKMLRRRVVKLSAAPAFEEVYLYLPVSGSTQSVKKLRQPMGENTLPWWAWRMTLAEI